MRARVRVYIFQFTCLFSLLNNIFRFGFNFSISKTNTNPIQYNNIRIHIQNLIFGLIFLFLSSQHSISYLNFHQFSQHKHYFFRLYILQCFVRSLIWPPFPLSSCVAISPIKINYHLFRWSLLIHPYTTARSCHSGYKFPRTFLVPSFLNRSLQVTVCTEMYMY